jgi:transposase
MMTQADDLSRSLVALEQDSTLICVIEMSQSSWLVAALAPGLARQPLKKLEPREDDLLSLLERWREECGRAGHPIKRVVVAFEAGRDGFWLARWLRARRIGDLGIEPHVIHAASVTVSREHRRAKTDRLDTQLLMRGLLGWLRGEIGHCRMCAIPTLEAEDARRPSREHETLMGEKTRLVNRMKAALARLGVRGFNPALVKASARLRTLRTPLDEPLPANTLAELERDMARLALLRQQVKALEAQRLERASSPASNGAPDAQSSAKVRLLVQMVGLGLATADMLTVELLSRHLRDRRAVARFAGLTGSPDESGARRREKGLARSGSARVRRGMIQLAWRFLRFQPDSELAKWFAARTAGAPPRVRKTMIVALARKLLIALWRMANTGQVPQGVRLHGQAA